MPSSNLTIKILGNATGALNALHKVGKASGKLSEEGKSLSGKLFHGVGSVLKKGALATGAAVGTVLTTSLLKGFSRLTAIDTAKAKLKGLGNSAADVTLIMKNANDSVLGTAFGLDEAATTAAGAVAAGIKPGKQLRKVLDSVANAAASSGIGMADMGLIYNQVATTGKAQNDTLRQVAEKGIPIYEALGKTLGVTGDQVFELAKKGKIGFPEFIKGMEKANGTVALEMGKTVTGTFQNLMAAMGRFGASMLQGVFPMVQQALAGMIKWFDALTKRVGPMMDAAAAKVKVFMAAVMNTAPASKFGASMQKIYAAGVKVRDFLQKAKSAILAFWTGLSTGNTSQAFSAFEKFAVLGAEVRGVFKNIISSVKSLFLAFGPLIIQVGSVLPSGFKLAFLAIKVFASVLSAATGFILQHKEMFSALIVALMAGYSAYKTIGAAIKVVTAVTKAWAIVQGVLNAVLNANPISLIIIAIAALAAGIVYAYKHCETFRNIVDTAFHAIAAVAQWLWQQIYSKLIRLVLKGFSWMMNGIANFLDALSHVPGFGWAKDAANKMRGAARAADDLSDSIGGIQGKTVTVKVIHRDIFISQHMVQGVSVPSHKRVKGFASGGTNIPAGLAWVGEQGPELMYVPGGSTIWDADTSRKMASRKPSVAPPGTGPQVHVHVTVQGSVWAARDLAKELVNPIRDELVKVGRRNGGNIFPK